MSTTGVDQEQQRHDDLVMTQMFRGLDRQATVLSELRQRASIVLSASGLIASLFASEALKDGYNHGLVIAAVAVTAAGMACCIRVLVSVCDEGDLPARDGEKLIGGSREWQVTVNPGDLRPSPAIATTLAPSSTRWGSRVASTTERSTRGRDGWSGRACCCSCSSRRGRRCSSNGPGDSRLDRGPRNRPWCRPRCARR